MKKVLKNKIIKKIIVMLMDIIICVGACFSSYLLFASTGTSISTNNLIIFILINTSLMILSYYILKLYDSLWRYASIAEMFKLAVAVISFTVINMIISLIVNQSGGAYVPIRVVVVSGFIFYAIDLLIRFGYRFIRLYKQGSLKLIVKRKELKNKELVMVIGAGDAGYALVNEMLTSDKSELYPACIIDDDQSKIGRKLFDVPVVGDRTVIVEMAKKYAIQKIIVAMPSIDKKELTEIINICQETKCKVQIVPGIYQMLNEGLSVANVRNVEIKDLLGRDQIIVNLEEINGYLKDQVVLVSGGGGSIGSELCRQIAKSSPKQLIIVDIYENNAYEIEQELKRNIPELNLLVLIASVRDKVKINNIFETYRPNIVIHAAAHKHVPLMETSPNEAVKNNVFGTLNVAEASDKYGVKRFILISTDKAVNPTNVMGATKRICEMIVQTINKKSKTEFVAVRFGNVLGSNGSVIPLFKKQIENGGPVTVTDERITRFFMTIPEAVSLVLQAGSYAKGGEIFVLDMGEPVRIYDLAVNLIRLSGYTPNVDMKIEVTGLRPGEKLYEEILMDEEGLQETPNKLIHIGKPIELDEENLFKNLEKIHEAALSETDEMRKYIQDIVPTYKPNK